MQKLDRDLPETAESPFGGAARLKQTLSTSFIAEMYMRKCGVDVHEDFRGIPYIGMYECDKTGYKFWRPECVAGDEGFYHKVSRAWPNYYRTSRWEYPLARSALRTSRSVLEIGCGQGYFLRALEAETHIGLGLELNSEAIENKATSFQVCRMTIQDFARENEGTFGAVCSFQVLEHVVDPYSFLNAALTCLAPGGVLVISTPDNEYSIHKRQQDAFDLPPHHVGHFNEYVYTKIAGILGLQKPRIYLEPRAFVSECVLPSTEIKLAYRIASVAAKSLFYIAYKMAHEPGANMLVVFRKPA